MTARKEAAHAEHGSLTLALLCDPGCEAEAALEARELVGKEARAEHGYVVVDGCGPEGVARLCYRAQGVSRVLALIADGELHDPEELDEIKDRLLSFDYAPFRTEGGTFKAVCERSGEHPFQAHDVELKLGEILFEGKGWKVDLRKPDMALFCAVVRDRFVVGVDLVGRDLGKREYRAFHTRRSLRATVAYAACRAAGFTGKETLLDPLMADGSIAIEASLFASGTSPQRFTKEFAFTGMPFAHGLELARTFADAQRPTKVVGVAPMVSVLKMVRANAKLAGAMDAVTLTKCELDWLVMKFDEKSVDLIVSAPPASGKSTPLKQLERQHEALFEQAGRILKRQGTVLLVVEKQAEFLNAAQRHGFLLSSEREVWMGEKRTLFLLFRRA